MSLVDEYNGIPNNHTVKKATVFSQIQKKVNQLGYTVNPLDNGKIQVLSNGEKIIRTPNRVPKEEVKAHPILTDYPQNFQNFVNFIINKAGGLENQGFDIKATIQAQKNILEGKKTVAANEALDELERMFKNKVIDIKATITSPAASVPLDEWMKLFEEPASQKNKEDALVVPEEIILKSLEDKALSEKEIQELNSISADATEEYKIQQENVESNTRTESGIRIETSSIGGNAPIENEVRSTSEGNVGRRQDRTVDSTEERESSESKRRIAEASLLIGAERPTDRRDVQSPQPSKSEQEELLKQYAQENGLWLSEKTIAENSIKKLPTGKEADVYLDKGDENVTKIINYEKYSKTPADFLENRIELYNHLFKDTPYNLLGFTENDKGFAFVVGQPYIKGRLFENSATSVEKYQQLENELKNYMKANFGMEPAGLNAFSNKKYTIQDIHLKNVVQGEDGNLYIIDVVPSKKEVQQSKEV